MARKNKGGQDAPEVRDSFEMTEGRARKDANKKPSDSRVAIHVKKTTLAYEQELYRLQVETRKLQKHIRQTGQRVLLLFEGRDAAGKGGTIKRFTEYLNPRGARVVALEKPSDVERSQWYFQRYVAHLPAAGEMVFFDRSWYNRAMVEPVMGFCTDEQNKRFLKDVSLFERMLVKDGIKLFKLYFSVSKKEQQRRFKARENDFMKHYKISPVDRVAQELWEAYTIRKFQMLSESNRTIAPWAIIRSDNKKQARLNCMRYVLGQLDYAEKGESSLFQCDPEIVISGIDEIKNMETHMLHSKELPG